MVSFPHPIPDEATLRSTNRDVLDSLPFGVLLLEPDGTILDINEAEAHRAGQSRAELIGRDFFRDVAPCADVRDFAGAFREGARRGELSRTFKFVYTLPAGPADVIVHLYSAAPGFGYVLATIQTDHRQATRPANESGAENSRPRSSFIRSSDHHDRTFGLLRISTSGSGKQRVLP